MHGRNNKSATEVTRLTGLSHYSVAKLLHGEVDEPPEYKRAEQPGKLTSFHDTRRQALKAEPGAQIRASHSQGAECAFAE